MPMRFACTDTKFGMRSLVPLLALLFATPASAQYEPPKQMTLSPLGVELTKGHFSYNATDLSIGPFSLERSYLGGNPVDGFAAGRGGATDWEIGMLYQSGRLRGTGLYRDGGYVPNPF